VPIDDPRYGGPILLNPGGPGGSGASFAVIIGETIQQVVDFPSGPSESDTEGRYFDIIGFDPRGVGDTEPSATCLTNPAATWSWRMRESEEGILSSSDAALGRLWSMTHAFGSSCKLAMDAEDGPNIKQFMTTAFVARDMLEIVERHAEYNAHQAAQATHNAGRRARTSSTALARYTPGEAKLQYWGFSYGTVLGSTFASMFPDRVGRAVLDGVVNEWDYHHSYNGSLIDTEKAMESFYSYCLNSGMEDCPLRGNATTTAEIRNHSERILDGLYHNPFVLSSAEGPEVITYVRKPFSVHIYADL
jgi:pimeloyl-ACP methyl ester carboxylesterase